MSAQRSVRYLHRGWKVHIHKEPPRVRGRLRAVSLSHLLAVSLSLFLSTNTYLPLIVTSPVVVCVGCSVRLFYFVQRVYCHLAKWRTSYTRRVPAYTPANSQKPSATSSHHPLYLYHADNSGTVQTTNSISHPNLYLHTPLNKLTIYILSD